MARPSVKVFTMSTDSFLPSGDASPIAQNVGVMIGHLPGQTLASWQSTLTQALALMPDHLSTYMLSLEEGTRLHEAVTSGQLQTPDPDLTADMYEWTTDALECRCANR